ncbi:MAG: SDR family oxidoreductase [Alicyclobacillus sp.]|nr:SDR family oxidoreductase [Alicyclobacillus sp.]
MKRLALISGGAKGIGLGIASEFLRQGTQVVILDRDEIALSALVDKLEALGTAYFAYLCDVSDPLQVEDTVGKIERDLGIVNILVNNAGISPKRNGLRLESHLIPNDEWNRVIEVNLSSVFLLCKAVIPGMRKLGWGRVINISSQAGRTYSKIAGAHYVASKAGIIGFSRILAGENARYGITVNCVAPGRIKTSMMEAAGQEANEAYKLTIPVGRFGLPEDIAAVVAFLASERAGFITGATIDVNGGCFMG